MKILSLIKNYLNKNDLINLKLVNKKLYNIVAKHEYNLLIKSINLIKLNRVESFKTLFADNNILKLRINNIFTVAAEYGRVELCKWLSKRGADVLCFDNLAFELAASRGHLKLVKWFIKFKPALNTALNSAVFNGYLDVCKFLVSSGATFDDNLFNIALKRNYISICEWALANNLVDHGLMVFLI